MPLRTRALACLGVVLGCAALLVGLLGGERILLLTQGHAGGSGTLFLLLTVAAFAVAFLLGAAGVVCLYAATQAPTPPGEPRISETAQAHHHRTMML